MKTVMKRIVSILLLICIALSFVVPATYAEDSEDTETITYNFALYEDPAFAPSFTSGGTLKDMLYKTKCYDCNATMAVCLANKYAGDQINWVMEGNSFAEQTFLASTSGGLRLRRNAGTATEGTDNWAAFRVKVEDAGTYAVSVTKDFAQQAYTAAMYIFPAADGTMSSDDLIAAMTSQNSLGTATLATTADTCEVGNWTFANSGEYIIVLKNTGSSTRIYLDQITLTKVADAPENTGSSSAHEEIYNFALYEDALFAPSFTSGGTLKDMLYKTKCYDCNAIMAVCLENKYAGNQINWVMEGNSFAEQTFLASTSGGLRLRRNAGTSTEGTDNWVAFRVKVENAGTYAVSVTKDFAQQAYTAAMYIFPATEGTMSSDDLIAAMTSQNSLGTATLATTADTCEVGNWIFDNSGEYIIVLKNTGSSTRIYLDQITLTEVIETPPESSTQTTSEETTQDTTQETSGVAGGYTDGYYNFAIYEDPAFAPSFGNALKLYKSACDVCGKTIEDCLADKYAMDQINWKMEASSFAEQSFMANTSSGLRMRRTAGTTAEGTDNWVAFRVKLGAAGTYAVSIVKDYAQQAYNAQMYIFPATAQTMSDDSLIAAMTEENSVGTATLAMAADSCTVGSWTFAGAGEYIIVLKNIGSSTRIQLDQITFTEPIEDETPDDSVTGGYTDGYYNFALYEDAAYAPAFTVDGELSDRLYKSKCLVCGLTMKDCLADKYAMDQINWALEGTSFGEQTFLASTSGGFRLRYTEGTAADGEDNWVAFRVKVNTPGNFVVTAYKDFAYAYNAQMYIFPAEAGAMSADVLTAAMVDKNAAGNMAFKASTTSYEVCQWNFDKAGEYIIALKNIKGSRRIYLDQITLTAPVVEKPKTPVDEKVYDFDLVAKNPEFLKYTLMKKLSTGGQLFDWIEKQYQEDNLQWKYETNSETFNMGYPTFREGCLRFKAGENYKYSSNAWIAFRLDSPGAGKYDVRLVSNDKSKLIANVYLIPATSKNALEPQQIQQAMTKENLLVKGAILNGKETFYLGEYTFDTTNEYIMVLECTKGTLLHLSKIQMTKDGLKADGTVKKEKVINGTVYNLNLADSIEGFYVESRSNVMDKISDMNARWASGELNWKYITASDDLINGDGTPADIVRFYRETGLRAYSTKDSWIALKIKSPGSGNFTVSLNHSTCPSSGTVAMYILPADTAQGEIWNATDPTNRIGKAVLTNETGAVGVEPGATSFVGYWEFEAGKEYILVLECYENSEFASTLGYMNLCQIVMERGIIDYQEDAKEKKANYITVAENVVQVADPRQNAVVAEVNGHDYYFLPLEGNVLTIFDLTTGELVDQVQTVDPHPRAAALGPDGKVYIGGSCKYLTWYDPITEKYEKTARFTDVKGMEKVAGIGGIAIAPDGMIYMTCYYGAYLASYNPQTKQFHSYGQLFTEADAYIGALTYYDGYLYVHYYSSPVNWSKIVKVDPATGKIVATADISEFWTEQSVINRLAMLGDDYLVAAGNKLSQAFMFNPVTMEIVENDLLSGFSIGVTEEIDGKHYVVMENMGLHEYDIATKTFSKCPGFGNDGIGFYTGQVGYSKTLVTINGDRCLFTFTNTGGHPRLYNLEKQEYIAWNHLVVNVGGAAEIRGFASGPEGSNELYLGAYNSPYCGVFNTAEGKLTMRYLTAGQTDSQVYYNGKLYAGNYSSTTLNEIELVAPSVATDPPTNEFIQRWKLDHNTTEQLRIYTLVGGDGYIFAGTVPGAGITGGSVTVYNTTNGKWFYDRNVVPGQSINCLEHHGKLLYGTTSIHGGGEGYTVEGASAVVFVYDYINKETIATLDPRDYISGLPNTVDVLYGIDADPNVEENGRFWVTVADTLFCFTFDIETKTFDVQEVISFWKESVTISGNLIHSPKRVLFDAQRNYLYVSFNSYGGFQRIELENWDAEVGKIKVKSNKRLMGKTPKYMLMGEDGNIYFGNNGALCMLPLNVTEEEWAIAEAVDQMILDIGDEITLETKTAINEARSAYENLSWYYKALIQNEELLKEKETDLLECKIEPLQGKAMTADDYPAMQELMAEYKALDSRQKRYVKNYEALKGAYDQALALYDQQIAETLQKRINALQNKFPLTLDDEPEVLTVRADFDALSGGQKLLVDAAILEEAEAQIAVLRAELVKHVETLIQAIPDEITLADEAVIMTAKEGVDKLYNNELKQISYAKFDKAFSMLNRLKIAKGEAEEVDALIKAIGIVTLGDKDRIAEARDAYDSLDELGLQFVTKEKKLLRAQWILKALQSWGIPVIVIVDAGIVFAVLWFVPSLHKKVFKAKKKEEETTENRY